MPHPMREQLHATPSEGTLALVCKKEKDLQARRALMNKFIPKSLKLCHPRMLASEHVYIRKMR